MKRTVETGGCGMYVRGVMDASGVQAKVVAAKSGVHESTLSRFFNGLNCLHERQIVLVGIAIGEAKAESRRKATT